MRLIHQGENISPLTNRASHSLCSQWEGKKTCLKENGHSAAMLRNKEQHGHCVTEVCRDHLLSWTSASLTAPEQFQFPLSQADGAMSWGATSFMPPTPEKYHCPLVILLDNALWQKLERWGASIVAGKRFSPQRVLLWILVYLCMSDCQTFNC